MQNRLDADVLIQQFLNIYYEYPGSQRNFAAEVGITWRTLARILQGTETQWTSVTLKKIKRYIESYGNTKA